MMFDLPLLEDFDNSLKMLNIGFNDDARRGVFYFLMKTFDPACGDLEETEEHGLIISVKPAARIEPSATTTAVATHAARRLP